jgi:hypothetical protein
VGFTGALVSSFCTMYTHARNIDARGSNINNVGRDQHNHVHNLNIYINTCSSIPERERRPLQRDLHYDLQIPTSTPHSSSQNGVYNWAHHFKAGHIDEVAIDLIRKIETLLVDDTDPSNDECGLRAELELLRQTLILARLAVITYEYTPVG